MKRRVMRKVLTVTVICMSLLITIGCQKEKTEETNNSPVVETTTTYLSLGTAGTGGVYYPLGGAIANIINNYVDNVEVTAEITGGSAENVTLVGTNELQMGMANSNLIFAGYRGISPYKESYPELRGLFTIQPSVIQIVTLNKSGINNIGDLKDKRVVLGPAGGGQIVLFNEYIQYYDMTMNDIQAVYISFAEGINELLDGNVDAVLVMAAIPTGAIMELDARSNNYKIIQFEEDVIDKIVVDSPYFIRFVLSKKTYNGLQEDIVTMAATSGVFARAEMDEAVAYNICKEIYKHLDILVNTVESSKAMSIESGKKLPIPLHPGAERFYKEKGVF